MILDFQNFSLEKCKELVKRYQETDDPETFRLLLARFDRYILYVLYQLKKNYSYLKNEEMQELYHTGILGFNKGIKAFKLHLHVSLLLLVIKAYIKSEIKQTYSYKNKEIYGGVIPLVTNNLEKNENKLFAFIIKESLFSSNKLNNGEKELLKLRYGDDLTIKEISKKLGMRPITLYKKYERLVVKMKSIIFKET